MRSARRPVHESANLSLKIRNRFYEKCKAQELDKCLFVFLLPSLSLVFSALSAQPYRYTKLPFPLVLSLPRA